MPSPVLARADALMQRRRQNLSDTEDVPVLTDSVGNNPADSDDDIPVLFASEIAPEPVAMMEPPFVAESTLPGNNVPAEPFAPLVPIDTANNEALILELASRVEKRLLAALPRIIEATVRDFLAEQENRPASQNATDNT